MINIKSTECRLNELKPGELFSMFPIAEVANEKAVGVACYIRTEQRSAKGSEGIVHRVEVRYNPPTIIMMGDLWRLLPAMGYSIGADESFAEKNIGHLDITVWKPGNNERTGALIVLEDRRVHPSATELFLYEGLDYQRMFNILQRLEGLLA